MSAIFSPCRTYRYVLTREWLGGNGVVNFVGLNPSTADETQDDPTIRRCVGYAKAWGFSGLCMLNLFAFRATDPKVMLAAVDRVGPENERWLHRCITTNEITVAAWGVIGGDYGNFVRARYPQMKVLRLTKDGHPSHPLYLPKNLTPQEWTDAARAAMREGT